MDTVRSFIAILLPEELRLGLSKLQVRLKTGNNPWIKWADPNGIHLTLKFLGNVPLDRISEIGRVLTEATREIPPFHLETQGLGIFPNLKRVQVVWLGLGGELDKLGQLHKQIESGLSRLGFTPEARAFKAHLTLARLRPQASPDERQDLSQLIANTKPETSYIVKVETISLMRSQLTREGARYSQLSSARLEKKLYLRVVDK
jgi:2'-5' RNA ligase